MKRLWFTALVLLASTGTASADDQCENDCPSGQVRAGFADGDRATCQCFEQTAGMVETTPAEIPAVSPSPEHGEPMPDNAPDPTVVDDSDGNAPGE